MTPQGLCCAGVAATSVLNVQIIHYTLHLRLQLLVDLGGSATRLLMPIPMLMLLDIVKDFD